MTRRNDAIRDNIGTIDENRVHGVKLDQQGRALSYQVWRRLRLGTYEFDREVSADDALFHGYFPTERSDQVRGIGLITAGLNDFVDAYEWQDLTKATAKLRTAFAMIVSSNALDAIGETTNTAADDETPKYEVDLGKGPFKLELDPGEDVKFLHDESHSANTFDFFKSTIGFALKSLDIPLSFYDEALTNFFGQRAALVLYLESCKTKRRNLISNILRPLTTWKIQQWVAQKRLKVPPNGDINHVPFRWTPAGVPYWNPSQEINADIQAIQAGLGNWEDIYMERTGRDWFADMLRRKEQTDFLEANEILLDPTVIQVIQSQ
jgi:capsid protein